MPFLFSHNRCRFFYTLLVSARFGLLGQAADRQVVDHLLDLLHVVFKTVVPLSKGVVLQVEQTEAGVQLVDEVGDAKRSVVVSSCDAVYCQPGLEERTTQNIGPKKKKKTPSVFPDLDFQITMLPKLCQDG